MTKRHTDARPGWILRRFAKIEKQQREDRAAKKLQAATIGKGGVTVKDGGGIKVLYPDGKPALTIGAVSDGTQRVGTQALFVEEDGERQVWSVLRIPPNGDFPTGASSFGALADEIRLTSDGDYGVTLGSTSGANAGIIVLNEADATGILLSSPRGVKIDHSTTGAAANCFIDPSDKRIWRSTSSARRKVDIEDAEIDPAAVLQMRGVTFRDKGQVDADPDTQTRYVGFIAEELHDLGLTQFVDYDAEGQPDAISYDRLSVALLAVIKSQDERLTALEERLADEGPAES